MANVRDPVGVDFDGDGVTSPGSRAATGTDVRAAAGVLAAENIEPAVAQPRLPAPAIVGGGLLAALLIALVVSVIWVSNSAKHPLVQPIPSPPMTTAAPPPSPTVADGPPALVPASTPMLPPPPVNIPAPVETGPVATVPRAPVTAETVAPAPPPKPRLPRLRDLFPRLFPNG
jgi:hypothetical protein